VGRRTRKLGFEPLAHEAALDVVEGFEDVGGHDGLFVGGYGEVVCATSRLDGGLRKRGWAHVRVG
jgi:hypothetical protein